MTSRRGHGRCERAHRSLIVGKLGDQELSGCVATGCVSPDQKQFSYIWKTTFRLQDLNGSTIRYRFFVMCISRNPTGSLTVAHPETLLLRKPSSYLPTIFFSRYRAGIYTSAVTTNVNSFATSPPSDPIRPPSGPTYQVSTIPIIHATIPMTNDVPAAIPSGRRLGSFHASSRSCQSSYDGR